MGTTSSGGILPLNSIGRQRTAAAVQLGGRMPPLLFPFLLGDDVLTRTLGLRRKHLFFPANRVFWDISHQPAAFENRNPFMQNALHKARILAG
ncbi:MAG: hypothetical protein U9Q79_04445 [Candidatus Hydrogenedentes bacterium]|nr:hypothetical protein [Candidatus Hydrogenedentota bacterium]